MLLSKSCFVVTALAVLASPAVCGPTETNAQRMARGLPPLPPRFKWTVPGRRNNGPPTPAGGWYPKPSTKPPPPPPSTPYSGCLEVRDDQGNALGHVKNTNTSSPIGGLSLSKGDGDLKVSFNVPQPSVPFDVLATNPIFSEPYYVGAAGTLDINWLDPTSKNTLAFTNVQQTPAGSVSLLSTFDSTLMVQSAIWSFNSDSNRLTAQYINPDGSSPATVLAYDSHANTLFFVGDIDDYNVDNNNSASAVNLFLVGADDNDDPGNDNGSQGKNSNGQGDNDNSQGHGH
ncbi:hypothetical protein J132_06454 [Termitomyces sp. J132]|nr:hypothetical protein H2248_010604 [Termitomyces sp. 'cryptogamus']KNZ74500.1 hypothetical protein J132_06454 [Termitomyces sp. J132]